MSTDNRWTIAFRKRTANRIERVSGLALDWHQAIDEQGSEAVLVRLHDMVCEPHVGLVAAETLAADAPGHLGGGDALGCVHGVHLANPPSGSMTSRRTTSKTLSASAAAWARNSFIGCLLEERRR